MKRGVIKSLAIVFISFFLLYYVLINIPALNSNVLTIDSDYPPPSIERKVLERLGYNRLSLKYLTLSRDLEKLSYVESANIKNNVVNIEYKDGIILSGPTEQYFFDGDLFSPLAFDDLYSLAREYLVFSLSSESLHYFTHFPNEKENGEILSLLMDISKQNSYNGKVVKKAEYYLSSSGDFGELRLYSESGLFTLSLYGYSSPSFVLSSISEIDSMILREHTFFELNGNTLLRRYA